jgi:hypothetical protein
MWVNGPRFQISRVEPRLKGTVLAGLDGTHNVEVEGGAPMRAAECVQAIPPHPCAPSRPGRYGTDRCRPCQGRQVRMVWVLQGEPPCQRGSPRWYSHAHWTSRCEEWRLAWLRSAPGMTDPRSPPSFVSGSCRHRRRHAMDTGDIPRREFLVQGSAAVAGLTLANFPFFARAFPARPGEVVIPRGDA